MKVPNISVVVAAFNEEKYLTACLSSIVNQEYPKDKFDITVVDNNSTDNTAQISREFGVNVVEEKKQGNTFALRKGMGDARGDIIAVTDADSQVPPNWLLLISKAFENPEIVAVTGRANVDIEPRMVGTLMSAFYTGFINLSSWFGKPNLSGFNLAVRRDAFLKVGGINPLFAMSPDVELGLRLKKVGKIKIVNGLCVLTSGRRWKSGFAPALWEYAKGYVYANWLHRPPPIKQKIIR